MKEKKQFNGKSLPQGQVETKPQVFNHTMHLIIARSGIYENNINFLFKVQSGSQFLSVVQFTYIYTRKRLGIIKRTATPFHIHTYNSLYKDIL